MTNPHLTPTCHGEIASHLAGLDGTARQVEQRWGVGRLRLLIDATLRAKFDRQTKLLNEALQSKTALRDEILGHIGGMQRAWLAVEQAATAAGHKPTPPEVWEVALDDGSVALIVRDNADASQVTIQAKERQCSVFTLAEIGNLLSRWPTLARAKEAFPGAVVTHTKAYRPSDDFNDPIPF